jgi:cobalamin biosynthesis protein CobT
MSMLDKEAGLAPRRGMVRRLSPEITELRDKIIERFDGKPLNEIAEFVQKVLATEQNETRRIAALAARVVIIRNHINNLAGIEPAVKSKGQKKKQAEESEGNPTVIVAHGGMSSEIRPGMKRVRIIEDAEVYGFQFPAGVIVDVKEEDAARLLEANKAELTDKDITGDDVAEGDVTAVEIRENKDAEAEEEAEAEAQEETEEEAEEDAATQDDATEDMAAEEEAGEAEAEEENANDETGEEAEDDSAEDDSAEDDSAEDDSAEDDSAEDDSAEDDSAEDGETDETEQ